MQKKALVTHEVEDHESFICYLLDNLTSRNITRAYLLQECFEQQKKTENMFIFLRSMNKFHRYGWNKTDMKLIRRIQKMFPDLQLKIKDVTTPDGYHNNKTMTWRER
jgi:hypothetical protein